MVGDKTVLEVLQEKHPPVATPTIKILLNKEVHKPHAILFQGRTPVKLRRWPCGRRVQPGSLAWIRKIGIVCFQYNCKGAAGSLFSALSRMAVLICMQEVPPSHLEAFLANRLIAPGQAVTRKRFSAKYSENGTVQSYI